MIKGGTVAVPVPGIRLHMAVYRCVPGLRLPAAPTDSRRHQSLLGLLY
jgi:hypothetical protein